MKIVRVLYSEDSNMIVCPICHTKFIFLGDYISHLKTNHKNVYPYFVSDTKSNNKKHLIQQPRTNH